MSDFNYKDHFEKLLNAIHESLNSIAMNYTGIHIEFDTQTAGGISVVTSSCTVANDCGPRRDN